ncbi:MAG: response regulator [bacterium]|nr:response regulator [bacterium]
MNEEAPTILITDRDQLAGWSLQNELMAAGYRVSTAASGGEVIQLSRNNPPGMIVYDAQTPDVNGMDLLNTLAQMNVQSAVILVSDQDDARSAVEALKAGAVDYVPRPFEMGDLVQRIDKAMASRRIDGAVYGVHSEPVVHHGLDNVVAVGPAMQKVIGIATQIARQSNSTVLLRGETGVGKDLMARAIHRLSPRSEQPFVEINCPSFPSPLLESELFGHEKGAYTDARTQKKGLLEVAHLGTVFLNEIGEIEPNIQAKLLQFLEQKVFRRIGSTQERLVDVRVIAATNQPLERAVEEGRFRQDLYFRLNVIPIVVPPLRERKEDVVALVDHFLRIFRSEFSRPDLTIEPEALRRLKEYNWPGNVRELKNVLERMALLQKNNVMLEEHLPEEILHAARPQEEEASPLVEQEKVLILKTMKESGWNQSLAARRLKITRDTLRYRMKKYNIRSPLHTAY